MFFSFQTVYSRKFQITLEKICPKLWVAVWHNYDQAQALSRGWKENATCSTNFRDKLPFVNSMKSLIFDSTKILLPKLLVLTNSLIAKLMHYQIIFTELKSSYYFLVMSSFIWVVIFWVELWLLIREEKCSTLTDGKRTMENFNTLLRRIEFHNRENYSYKRKIL